MRLSHAAFCVLVERALNTLPPQFKPYLEELTIDVEDMPDAALARDLGLDDPRQLLGYYHGQPLTERSHDHGMRWPERIVVYHLNIQRICRTRAEIIDQVRRTVLHEIGHHFGLDEEDLEDLGYA